MNRQRIELKKKLSKRTRSIRAEKNQKVLHTKTHNKSPLIKPNKFYLNTRHFKRTKIHHTTKKPSNTKTHKYSANPPTRVVQSKNFPDTLAKRTNPLAAPVSRFFRRLFARQNVDAGEIMAGVGANFAPLNRARGQFPARIFETGSSAISRAALTFSETELAPSGKRELIEPAVFWKCPRLETRDWGSSGWMFRFFDSN